MRGDLFLTALFSLLLILLACSLVETKESQERYLALIRPPLQTAAGSKATQERQGVRKDLYLSEKEGPLHALITLPKSTLLLTDAGTTPRVEERFGPFEGLVQEKIERGYPNSFQYIRSFSGESGSFSFAEQKLTAKELLLARYKVPGTELPSTLRGFKPEMKGVAASATLTFSDSFEFTANHVKATFQLPEGKK